jgi:hypothetical protein
MTTSADLSFLYSFDLSLGGQDIRFDGELKATPTDLVFTTSNDGNAPIVSPLGLTGVTLTGPQLTGRISTTADGQQSIDLALNASASFTSLSGFDLNGAIVLDGGAPRLAVVELAADQPLTLTQFMTSVLGSDAAFASEVTDQFAFLDGQLYWLETPAGQDPASYTWPYAPPGRPAVTYSAGYNLQGTFQMFGKFDFQIALEVTPATSSSPVTAVLSTPTPQTIDILPGFVSLDKTRLQYGNGLLTRHLAVDATVSVLGTALGEFKANYEFEHGAFTCTVHADLQDVSLDISFAWAKDTGFRITEIDGLPLNELDLAGELEKRFNQPGSCKQLAAGLFNQAINTKVQLAVDKKSSDAPHRDGTTLIVPLMLTCTVTVALGDKSASIDIPLKVEVPVPQSLQDLPGALWTFVRGNIAKIAEGILANRSTYAVIAFEIARRGAAAGFARMICRARTSEEGSQGSEGGSEGNNLAQDLVDEAQDLDVGLMDLAAAAELAGAMAGVVLIKTGGALDALAQAIEDIKNAFTGGESEEHKAEDRINAIHDSVKKHIDLVQDKIDAAVAKVGVQRLVSRLDVDGRIGTDVVWSVPPHERGDLGGHLTCHLKYLSRPHHTLGLDGSALPTEYTVVDVSDATFPDRQDFERVAMAAARVNTALQTTLCFTFDLMEQDALVEISQALVQLGDNDNPAAVNLKGYLQTTYDQFVGYNTAGVTSDWFYASTEMPRQLMVGYSHIGITSMIRATEGDARVH